MRHPRRTGTRSRDGHRVRPPAPVILQEHAHAAQRPASLSRCGPRRRGPRPQRQAQGRIPGLRHKDRRASLQRIRATAYSRIRLHSSASLRPIIGPRGADAPAPQGNGALHGHPTGTPGHTPADAGYADAPHTSAPPGAQRPNASPRPPPQGSHTRPPQRLFPPSESSPRATPPYKKRRKKAPSPHSNHSPSTAHSTADLSPAPTGTCLRRGQPLAPHGQGTQGSPARPTLPSFSAVGGPQPHKGLEPSG